MTDAIIYPPSWCYVASAFAVLFCVFGVSGEESLFLNLTLFYDRHDFFRKLVDYRSAAKM